MARATTATNRNVRLAKQRWGTLPQPALVALRELSREYRLSVALGDLLYLDERWYVSHAGLLRIAQRKKCVGIKVECIGEFSDPAATRWAFKATVFKSGVCKGFVGYGDADPSNVSTLVHGAEMRVAETRAVNRALRKAYGIGVCSVEEIGSFAETAQSYRKSNKIPPHRSNGNYGGSKVRDRLCQIIRQHQLDPTLVKAYGRQSEFGTEASQPSLRHPAQSIARHRNEEDNSQRSSAVHAGACLQVQAE